MFFVASKILAFLISPLVWIFSLGITAFFIRKPVRKRNFFVISFVLLFLFSNPYLCNLAMNRWEIPAISDEEIPPGVSTAVLLGGVSFYDHNLERIQFSRSSDRLFQTLRLYRQGIVKKVIISGGSGSLIYPDDRESVQIKSFLMQMKLNESDFIIEPNSRNTEENARFTRQVADSCGLKGPVLLVSSGFHLKRAMRCFEKHQFTCIPYATDRYSGDMVITPAKLFVPDASVLVSWDVLIHEMVGYLVYAVAGYLD